MWLAIAGLGHGDHRRARWYVILATLSSESLISNVFCVPTKYWNRSSPESRPEVAIECAILNRLTHVARIDALFAL